MKTVRVFEVVIVDKNSEKVLVNRTQCAQDGTSAIAAVAVAAAEKLAGKDLCTYTRELTNFNKD